MKYKTFNCGVWNDVIYLFYSIFFMSLSRYVFDKTIFLDKAIYLGKAISLTTFDIMKITRIIMKINAIMKNIKKKICL